MTDDPYAVTNSSSKPEEDQDIEQKMQQSGEKLLIAWQRQAPSLLKKERREFAEFQKYLFEIWGEVLELLEILLSTALEKGAAFNDTHQNSLDEDTLAIFRAANHLFGRACQVGREIHLLLSHGYADGAEGRWRTLYEIVVVATFIMRNDPEVALRYIAHEAIDTYKAMKQYDAWRSEGIEVFTEDQIQEITQQYELMLSVFGKDFKYDYAWAAKALGKKRVYFLDIEEAAGHEYLRPVYKEANANIHATSRGTSIRLGLPGMSDMILAGYSVYGIGEVTQNTAFCLLLFV